MTFCGRSFKISNNQYSLHNDSSRRRVVQRLCYRSPNKMQEQIIKRTSNTAFKFGDGHKVYSFKKVRIPANMGGTECVIDVETVREKIPLLLSKQSLINARLLLILPMIK